jgi:hypothetical protein
MTRVPWGCLLGLLLAGVRLASARESIITPDLSRLDDAKSWQLINAESTKTPVEDKWIIHLKPIGEVTPASNVGLAVVKGLEFREGTVEVDLKGKGKSERCFLGVAFNVVDGKTFEAVYFRPFNFLREPEVWRSHSVQYVAWPVYTWEKLRAETPDRYESRVKPIPDPSGWFHARIEVSKQKVRVWVDAGKEPSLVVDRLGRAESGKIGLWVDSHDAAFRNLKIRPAAN